MRDSQKVSISGLKKQIISLKPQELEEDHSFLYMH